MSLADAETIKLNFELYKRQAIIMGLFLEQICLEPFGIESILVDCTCQICPLSPLLRHLREPR